MVIDSEQEVKGKISLQDEKKRGHTLTRDVLIFLLALVELGVWQIWKTNFARRFTIV